MATTTNYGWTTPDDTDLVKDGAAAIRTLGSSVDTTTKALNPSTTEGDIEYRSSTADTNSRLAIGTAGQVLTVNGGATAPEWAAAASTTASYTLLGSAALTGATTITVSGLSGYNNLFVTMNGASTATNNSFITFKFNSASANHYAFGSKIQWQSSYGSGLPAPINQTNVGAIQFGRMPNNVGATGNGTIQIVGANTTVVKPFLFQAGFTPDGGFYDEEFVNGGGYFDASAVISSVSLISSTGNFDAGTLSVYGSVA